MFYVKEVSISSKPGHGYRTNHNMVKKSRNKWEVTMHGRVELATTETKSFRPGPGTTASRQSL